MEVEPKGPFRHLVDRKVPSPVELKTNLMRPAKLGPLIATGRAVFKGKSIGLVERTLRDDGGIMIATAAATVRIVSPQPEKESS